MRINLDLPDTDNDCVRALEGPINDVIARDLAVGSFYLPQEAAEAEPGLFRSKGVSPPPQDDGLVRIVEITELDRHACGDTHLRSTGEARRISILKVENKGRHNRRFRIGLGQR